MLIHKASEQSERRITAALGIIVVICSAAVAVVAFANPFGGRDDDRVAVVIESSYGGRGVKEGTALMLHGFQVGQVTKVTALPGGRVRVAADLQRAPASGLTTALGIDFRPANYFGVTGINLRPANGGQPLRNGSLIETTPAGNFTLQVMLSQFGEFSHGVLTPQLVNVIDKATSYTDALDSLIETMVVVSRSVTNVQTVRTARLLAHSAGISVALPGFMEAATALGDAVQRPVDGLPPAFFDNLVIPSMDYVSAGFFAQIGTLEGAHSSDLAPLTDITKVLTDIVPGLLPPDDIADTARELRTRLERLFAGPPDRRAIDVRVILDSLPGIAAPAAAMGVAP